MLIASKKRKENIAEYLLYMWQVEDIIRAFGLDIDRIADNLIAPVPDITDEQRADVRAWYESLIDMMRREGVVESGHLQMNRNTLGDLADLHVRLLGDARFEDYARAFYAALPDIVELRSRAGDNPAGEIETCFNALYAMLLMRMRKQDVSAATAEAMGHISRLIAMLAAYYAKDEAGLLFGKEEDSDQ